MKSVEHMSSRGLFEDFFVYAVDEEFVCDFNPSWGSWFGHFELATQGLHAPVLGLGQVQVSKEPASNGDVTRYRRVVIIGTNTPGDNLVLFDQYSDPNGHGPVMFNAGEETKKWLNLPDYSGVFTKEMWLDLINKYD